MSQSYSVVTHANPSRGGSYSYELVAGDRRHPRGLIGLYATRQEAEEAKWRERGPCYIKRLHEPAHGSVDARANPVGGTFVVTHANPRGKGKVDYSGFKFHKDGSVTLWDVYQQQWRRTSYPSDEVLASFNEAERKRIMRHVGMELKRPRGDARANPAYRASFTATGDPAAVRRSLKASGYTDVRLRGATKGPKRKPGPYAIFVQSHMKGLMARGLSAPEAMKEIGRMWRAKESGAKSNPRRRDRRRTR